MRRAASNSTLLRSWETTRTSKFRYTDEQRDALAKLLPGKLDVIPDLEMLGAKHIDYRRRIKERPFPTPAMQKKAWAQLAITAKKLRTEIEGIDLMLKPMDVFRVDGSLSSGHDLKELLDQLPQYAASRASSPIQLVSQRVSNRVDYFRDRYLESLCRIWCLLGGSLKTSVDNYQGAAAGPLVGFLGHASGPVFEMTKETKPTADALRAAVRKISKLSRVWLSK